MAGCTALLAAVLLAGAQRAEHLNGAWGAGYLPLHGSGNHTTSRTPADLAAGRGERRRWRQLSVSADPQPATGRQRAVAEP